MNGFTGHFCEFKTEQDHLLFVGSKLTGSGRIYISFLLNADGRLIEENALIDKQADAYQSCSTMLNGEAIIFGGWWSNIKRQVN